MDTPTGSLAKALTAALVAGTCAAACAGSEPAGVTGRVLTTPARPGPQLPGESALAPLPGTDVTLVDGHGKVVGRATTGADGTFTIDAPAGSYDLRAGGRGVVGPRCPPVTVILASRRRVSADLVCDSGMR